MNTETLRRPVGRPRTGKVNMMLSIDPEIRVLIIRFAEKAGLNRSQYIEKLIRSSDKNF